MKKSIILASLFAMSAAAFVSCNKDIETPAVSEEPTVTIQATAFMADTRTELNPKDEGGYSVLWSAKNESVRLLRIKSDGTQSNTPHALTPNEDRTSATFEIDAAENEIRYWVVYPASAIRKAGNKVFESAKDNVFYTFDKIQENPQNGNPYATLLFAAAERDGDKSIAFEFKHIASFGKVTLTGVPEELNKAKIKSVTLTVLDDEAQLTGAYIHHPSTGTGTGDATADEGVSNSVTVNYSTPIGLTDGAWFTVMPSSDEGYKNFTFKVEFDNGDTYIKSYADKKLAFKLGVVSNIALNFSDAAKEEGSLEAKGQFETFAWDALGETNAQTVEIDSDLDWEVAANADWITAAKEGNRVKVYLNSYNDIFIARTGNITVSAKGAAPLSIPVSQEVAFNANNTYAIVNENDGSVTLSGDGLIGTRLITSKYAKVTGTWTITFDTQRSNITESHYVMVLDNNYSGNQYPFFNVRLSSHGLDEGSANSNNYMHIGNGNVYTDPSWLPISNRINFDTATQNPKPIENGFSGDDVKEMQSITMKQWVSNNGAPGDILNFETTFVSPNKTSVGTLQATLEVDINAIPVNYFTFRYFNTTPNAHNNGYSGETIVIKSIKYEPAE